MKKFSDFAANDTAITGTKIKLENVLGKEIIVKGYKITDSRYNNNKLLTLQFNLKDEDHIVFTGSTVLMDQVEKYKDEIPFITKIEKVNKFYSFT